MSFEYSIELERPIDVMLALHRVNFRQDPTKERFVIYCCTSATEDRAMQRLLNELTDVIKYKSIVRLQAENIDENTALKDSERAL